MIGDLLSREILPKKPGRAFGRQAVPSAGGAKARQEEGQETQNPKT